MKQMISECTTGEPKNTTQTGSMIAVTAFLLIGLFACLLIGLSACLLTGCESDRTTLSRNVILISLDTLRSDFLGCYGNPTIRTPWIDALSQQGIVCADHHANSNWTLPSHVSMLTSQYAADHHIVYDNRPLPDSANTLAESYRQAGYRTGGFYSVQYFAPDLNLCQGFDTMEEYDFVHGAGPQRVIQWLNTASGYPYFLFLHSFEPHAPYGGYREYRQTARGQSLRNLPEFDQFTRNVEQGSAIATWRDFREAMLMMLLGFRKGHDRHDPAIQEMVRTMTSAQIRLWKDAGEVPISDVLDPWFASDLFHPDTQALIDNYRLRIEYSDRALGHLLQDLYRLDCFDRTMICVTSDHGEAFFEHGHVYGHGGNRRDVIDPHLTADSSFHWEEIATPMILWNAPFSPKPHIQLGLTCSLDVMPTLLAQTRMEAPATVHGIDVTQSISPERYTVVENQRTVRRAIITSDWKLIVGSGPPELYDRGADPGETVNMGLRTGEYAPDVSEAFDVWCQGRILRFAPDDVLVDPELRQNLQMLGYLHAPE
ncbi:sulfatase [bacterium]|nr:sulfatase [candidate division CSSED10-310 bacterium]